MTLGTRLPTRREVRGGAGGMVRGACIVPSPILPLDARRIAAPAGLQGVTVALSLDRLVRLV
jgi:hypothetical protein